MLSRRRTVVGEETQAAVRAVLGLTAGVGAMAAAASAVVAEPLVLVLAPTTVLVALVVAGRLEAAGYAATAVWLSFLPHAPAEAMAVPLAMSLLCLAIGLGPDRMVVWVREDFGGRRRDGASRETGWIEDDQR